MKKVLSRVGGRDRCHKFILLSAFILLFSIDFVGAQTAIVTGTENNVNISQVNLSVGSSKITQTSPSGNANPTPADAPVLIESVVLENGKELFVTTRKPEVTNLNPVLGTNRISSSAVEIINSSGPTITHVQEDFIPSLTEVVFTPDLRSYWSIGGQPSIANGEN